MDSASIYIFGKAHALEKAEADWQRKRTMAIAQSEMPVAALGEVRPTCVS